MSHASRPPRHVPRTRALAIPSALLVGALICLATVSAAFGAAVSGHHHPASPQAGSRSRHAPREWLTTADGSHFATALRPRVITADAADVHAMVRVQIDPARREQRIVGFGGALTEASAELLDELPAARRAATLRALFAPGAGAGIDVVRVAIGASDFAPTPYTYDDLPRGRHDPRLAHFSINHDDAAILPILRDARALNPTLEILATPWSAPAWMKTTDSLDGGTLIPADYSVYARYFVRFLRAYAAAGVPVNAITPQNEPGQSAAGYPSMTFTAAEESRFVARDLGAALTRAGLSRVQILGDDQNWSATGYAAGLLRGAAADRLAGTAVHCYAGAPTAQSAVHDAAPGKAIWMTECSGGAWSPHFAVNLGWDSANLLVGTLRHWASAMLFWNIALNPSGGPHDGGCPNCRGIVTIGRHGVVHRNVEFAELEQASTAVSRGGVRVASSASVQGVRTVAFANPDGSDAIILDNTQGSDRDVTVLEGGHAQLTVSLPAGATESLRWWPRSA